MEVVMNYLKFVMFLQLGIFGQLFGMHDRLINAAARGDNCIITQIIEQYGRFDSSNDEFFNVTSAAVLKACEGGHRDAVALLLNNGAFFTKKSLWVAVENGRTEIVRLLLTRSRDFRRQLALAGRSDQRPLLSQGTLGKELDYAAEEGHVDIVQLLIDAGAQDLGIALVGPSSNGNMAVIRLLVNNGADNFNDAIEFAAINGHVQVVDYFVSCGVTNLEQCLVLAAQNGHIEVIKLLINRGVNIVEAGRYAIVAALRNGHQDIAALLELCSLRGFKEFRADSCEALRFPMNIHLNQFLLWAVILDRPLIVWFLLRSGASVNSLDRHGMTALMYASMLGSSRMVASLVHKGAKIMLENDQGENALILSSRYGYSDICARLFLRVKRIVSLF